MRAEPSPEERELLITILLEALEDWKGMIKEAHPDATQFGLHNQLIVKAMLDTAMGYATTEMIDDGEDPDAAQLLVLNKVKLWAEREMQQRGPDLDFEIFGEDEE